ncbi:MAG: rhodanese-like domain-containing protein [Bacteroidales bacterium]|nr:rhodanese-like domain-containing protein [Bacteroidales bacterium]
MNALLTAVIVLGAALVVAACAGRYKAKGGQGAGFVSLSVDEFEKAISDKEVIRVDVRSQEEWEEGHIPGSIVIDVQKDDFLEKARALLPKDKTIAVNCRTGRRSKTAAGILAEDGYKVIDLDTGFVGWQEAGKPCEITD